MDWSATSGTDATSSKVVEEEDAVGPYTNGAGTNAAAAVAHSKTVGAGATEVAHSRFESTVITNDVPSNCQGVPCCMGIDEAGRGPVLGTFARAAESSSPIARVSLSGPIVYGSGSMVYGAAYWPLDEDEQCAKLGFNGLCLLVLDCIAWVLCGMPDYSAAVAQIRNNSLPSNVRGCSSVSRNAGRLVTSLSRFRLKKFPARCFAGARCWCWFVLRV